jgi:hypothetical protein
MRWELTMMRLAAACQKTLVSRTTRIASALMMFASGCPGTDRRQLIDVVADDSAASSGDHLAHRQSAMVFVHCLGERRPDHRRLLDVNPHHQASDRS